MDQQHPVRTTCSRGSGEVLVELAIFFDTLEATRVVAEVVVVAVARPWGDQVVIRYSTLGIDGESLEVEVMALVSGVDLAGRPPDLIFIPLSHLDISILPSSSTSLVGFRGEVDRL